jgi:hypothetical protein
MGKDVVPTGSTIRLYLLSEDFTAIVVDPVCNGPEALVCKSVTCDDIFDPLTGWITEPLVTGATTDVCFVE